MSVSNIAETLLKNADNFNYSAISNALKSADTAASIASYMKNLEPDVLTKLVKNLDADVLTTAFKNVDADKIASIAKNLDADKLNTFFKQLDKAKITDITKNLTPTELSNVLKKIDTSDANLIKKFDDVDADKMDLAFDMMTDAEVSKWARGIPDNQLIGAADDFALKNADEFKNLRNLLDDLPDPSVGKKGRTKQFLIDQADKFKNNSAVKAFVDKSSTALKKITDNPTVKSSLKKLGLYGVIGVVVCMLIYDEANPFKAIMKALEDIQETAEALKEIVDAAANAAKNAAKGGFDFLAWLFKYWYVPGILCFLLFAIYILT